MANCKDCGNAISWDGWTQGNPPNNPDGSPHKCQKQQKLSSGGSKYGYRIPMTKAPEVLNLALELGDTVLKRIDGVVEPKDQLVLTESIFKTLSQSYKDDYGNAGGHIP